MTISWSIRRKIWNFILKFNVDWTSFHNQFENVNEIEFIRVAIRWAHVTYYMILYVALTAMKLQCVFVCVCICFVLFVKRAGCWWCIKSLFIVLLLTILPPFSHTCKKVVHRNTHTNILQINNEKKGIHCQMQLYFVFVCVGMFTGTIIMNVKSFDMTAMHMVFTRDSVYKYISPSFLSIEKRKKKSVSTA